jgi:ATP-dependent protease ClpP protease subunit
MVIAEFLVHEDFTESLLARFNAFCDTLAEPCAVVFDIRSQGGHTEVLKAMESKISELKAKGFLIITSVNEFAYSCGLFLFLLGDIKTCDDAARFLFHASGFDIEVDRLVLEDLLEMAEILQADDVFVRRIIAENTELPAGMFEILKKNDNFLSKNDLVFLGLMPEEEIYEPI